MARPKTNQPTSPVRIPADLAEMLGWLAKLSEDETVAEIIDQLVRPAVEARFAQIKPNVDRIKAAKSELTAAHAPDLGESGA